VATILPRSSTLAACRSFRWNAYALSAGCAVAPTCPSSFQAELVLMLTRITQLRALSLTPATSLPIAPAGSSSLQTEFVLILTRPAETRTILRIGRSRKHHGKQTRRRKGNNHQFIVHVTHLSFSRRSHKPSDSPDAPGGVVPRVTPCRPGAGLFVLEASRVWRSLGQSRQNYRATAFGRTDPRTVCELRRRATHHPRSRRSAIL
jgi:hypothetical protein